MREQHGEAQPRVRVVSNGTMIAIPEKIIGRKEVCRNETLGKACSAESNIQSQIASTHEWDLPQDILLE
jgi:hypothetical protein